MNKKGWKISFLEIVFLVFLFLKLFGVVAWSWWIIFSPMLIELGITLICFLILWITYFFFDWPSK